MSLLANIAGSSPSPDARALTRLSAACALPLITSPSCPVRISRPSPGIRVASTNRISPPTGVQARPVATPGTLVRIATSPSKRGGPRISARSPGSIRTLCAVRRIGDLGLLGGQAVGLQLAIDKIAAGDLEFFVLDIAWKIDDLHAVAQRAGDRVEHVGRRDEHDPRQV